MLQDSHRLVGALNERQIHQLRLESVMLSTNEEAWSINYLLRIQGMPPTCGPVNELFINIACKSAHVLRRRYA